MKIFRTGGTLVLAINPSTRGFGFALFERRHDLIDWGMRKITPRKATRTLLKVNMLFQLYQPGVVVIEDYNGEGSRRSQRVQELIDSIVALAQEKGVKTAHFSRASVRACFDPEGAQSKDEIALVLVKQFPELEPRLPKKRKPWQSEDANMVIFDAVALAVTYFRSKENGKEAA